jgi:hypothetical protein
MDAEFVRVLAEGCRAEAGGLSEWSADRVLLRAFADALEAVPGETGTMGPEYRSFSEALSRSARRAAALTTVPVLLARLAAFAARMESY